LKSVSHWSQAKTRQAQLDREVSTSQTAFYGFQKVHSGEKVHRVRRHFHRIAHRYDRMNTILSFGIHHHWKRLAVRLLHLKPGDRVIDVCGGTADLAMMAARRVGPPGRVIVYDITPAMMAVGRRKVAQARLEGRIGFILGDAERISFSDGRFDAALVGFGIRNVTLMEKAFSEMLRVLKPGGKLMCLEFSKPVHPVFRWIYDLYSFYLMPCLGRLAVGSGQPYACLSESIRLFPLPEELAAVLKRIGFSSVTYRMLTNGIAVIHLAEKPSTSGILSIDAAK